MVLTDDKNRIEALSLSLDVRCTLCTERSAVQKEETTRNPTLLLFFFQFPLNPPLRR